MKKPLEGNQFGFEISELSLLCVLKSATEIQSKRPVKGLYLTGTGNH